MKIKTVLLLLFVQSLYLQAQENHPAPKLDLTLLEAHINQAITEKKIPSVVIAVARNGVIVYEKAFGYADVAKKTKATIHTSYQLASTSKPFTATAIMMLHEKGLINLDSPVTKYVPELALKKADPHFSTPTVRQVLNHTSGLGTYFDIGYADEKYSFDSFEKGWQRYGTIFLTPGTVSEYSNLGYGLLDRVIANMSGKTYGEYMATELFKPLHLTDTYVAGYANGAGIAARKYNADGSELPDVINNTAGAGNIYASVHDLVRFGMFHLKGHNEGKAILNESQIRLMHSFKDENTLYSINEKGTFYGLGWYVQPGDNNSSIVWHEGGMPGASTMLKLFTKEGIALAVITNAYNYPFCREITDELTKIILPDRKSPPINEIAQYKPYTTDTSFMGVWDGKIVVEDQQIPATLSINEKEIILDYPDLTLKSFLTENQPVPHKTVLLYGMVNQNYFLGTTTGILPAGHLRKEFGHLLILKLLKKNNLLTGTITAMAAADREYYAYPFFLDLKKRE
jgi:CubicO group peptidase (beta-lactamase class C family)